MCDMDIILREASLKGSKYAKLYIESAKKNVLAKAKQTSYNNFSAASALNVAALGMVGIIQYAETGRFADLSHGNFMQEGLMEAYLTSLNKCHHGFDSRNMNHTSFDEICKQATADQTVQNIYNFIKMTIKQKAGENNGKE